jgi:hypothetical protein
VNSARKYAPQQFQLAETNVVASIVVSSRTKLDVLRVFCIFEPHFRCLVKATNDMFDIVSKRRISEIF